MWLIGHGAALKVDVVGKPENALDTCASLTIYSGGQTGVDRAALDAALAHGLPCGGWCPAGRKAEDGRIPDIYPLREHEGGYLARNRQNVLDSDGSLIIAFGAPVGGTAKTVAFCQKLGKPHLIIDGKALSVVAAAEAARQFIEAHSVRVLNVAGPSASREPTGYSFARDLLDGISDPTRQ